MNVSSRAGHGRLGSRPRTDVEPGRGAAPGVHPVGASGPRGESLLVVPPGLPEPGPLLVFCHGAGGQARHSLPVVQHLADRGVLVLLPTSAGSTWDLVLGRRPGADTAALDALLANAFAAHAVDRVLVGGFSDGASYALSLGLVNGDLVDAVLAFSPGFAAPPALIGAPRVWVSHGTGDTVLPVDRCGRRVVADLTRGGYDVHYDEFDGGHVVTQERVSAAMDWAVRA